MVPSIAGTLKLVATIALAVFTLKREVLSFFHTGFYQTAIDNTEDPHAKARLYSRLGVWDKRAEIDEEYGFITASFDYTPYGQQMNAETIFDLLDLLDSIDALSALGETEKAIKYLQQYDANSPIESETKDRYIDILTHQSELIQEKKEYIQLAIDQLQHPAMIFAKDIDLYIYVRHYSFLIVGELLLIFHAWFIQKNKLRTLMFAILFCVSSAWYFVFSGVTPLGRFLSAETIQSFLASLLFTPVVVSNRPSPNLERARQMFLKYPFVYEDLCSHQVMGLMTQVLWRELKRCNFPLPDNSDGIQPCYAAHRVANTIADMMDIDGSTDNLIERDFWYYEISFAIEQQVLNTATPWLNNIVHDAHEKMMDSEEIRTAVDIWLGKIIEDDSEMHEDNNRFSEGSEL